MKVEIDINSIDYEQLADVLLPALGKNIEEKSNFFGRVIGGRRVRNATGKLINKIPKNKKDEYTAKLINKNANRIAAAIEKTAKENGVDIGIRKLKVKP